LVVGLASATQPALSTAVVLAGRQEAVAALRARLEGAPQVITWRAGSLDEALAAVAAVALEEDSAGRGGLLARTAFVDSVATWRVLADHPSPLVLVARTPEVIAEARSAPRHHVIVPLSGRVDADIELSPLDVAAAREALVDVGIDERVADDVGRLGRRSLLALRRHLARKPELHTPAWAAHPVSRVARGVLLAGSWNEEAPGDQEALAELSGLAYDDLRERLAELASAEDPLVTSVDGTWAVVSPFDAWWQLQGYVRPDDLRRFAPLVEKALLEDDPAASFPPERQWQAQLEGKQRRHSGDLRVGLATTIALLGSIGDRVDAGNGGTAASIAGALVRRVLTRANEDPSGTAWRLVGPYLPLLAEGAPDDFIDGVRIGCGGDSPVIETMFTDDRSVSPMFMRAAHPPLLWALELLAWSPEHFAEAVYLLARLTEIDPGGQLMNRPANSLADIFYPGHPETTASPARRLEVLDVLHRRYAGASWELMLKLVPAGGGYRSPTRGPRFRDWKPTDNPVTHEAWLEFVLGLAGRLVDAAGGQAARWQQLLEVSVRFSPAQREAIRNEFAHQVTLAFDAAERLALWETLRNQIAEHRDFASADWALPEEELAAVEALERLLAPSGAVERLAWLFEDWLPDLGDGTKVAGGPHYREALGKRRTAAVGEVDQSQGFNGLLSLARRSAVPAWVGQALARTGSRAHEAECLALLGSANGHELDLGWGYCQARFRDDGWAWIETALEQLAEASPPHLARLMLCTEDWPRSWERADELGSDVASAYWSAFNPMGLGEDFPHVAVTAARLIGARRAAAALDMLASYSRVQESTAAQLAPVAATALDALLEHQDDPELRRLERSQFQSLIDLLEEHRDIVGPDRVERLELQYLPALGYDARVLSLHERLAREPEFFVEVLTWMYRRRSAPVGEVKPEHRPRGEVAHLLLTSWHLPPGAASDGTIDPVALRGWVDAVMPLLDEVDRREVGEIHLGHVLAFASPDPDGEWPGTAVRDLLETLQSKKVEEGLHVQIGNNRGITSRSPEAGGYQERDLAADYRERAMRFRDRWPRCAAILRSLAESYEQDGRQHDAEAELLRTGIHR
jgi:hypothetical protein